MAQALLLTFDEAHWLPGACISDRQPARPYSETLSGRTLPGHSIGESSRLFKTNREVFLTNGDKCAQGNFVIIKDPGSIGTTYTARVEEILNVQNSVAHLSGMPDCVLLQLVTLGRASDIYGMPLVDLSGQWALVDLQASITSHPTS